MTTDFQTREDYLQTAAELISEYHLQDKGLAPEPGSFRVACGFARGKQRKDLAVFKREQSDAHLNEIFISPYVNDTLEVLKLLAEGLAEASADCSTAGKQARREAAITDSTRTAEKVKMAVGDYPHEPIKKPATGGTRQLKCECADPACGAVWRASSKWVEQMVGCPVCMGAKLILDGELTDSLAD